MDYLHLTPDQQAQIVNQKLLELESQHFQQALVVANCKAAAADSLLAQEVRDLARAQQAETEAAMRLLETTHASLASHHPPETPANGKVAARMSS